MKTTQDSKTKTELSEIVLLQLSKILTHPLFLSSDVLSRFLKFIVGETLAGRDNQIKEYTIALHVLNKPVGFLSGYDSIVRVHARRLRDTLSTYYGQKNSGDTCMITIPKGRYVPLFKKLRHKPPSKKKVGLSLYNLGELKRSRIAFMPFKTYDRNISWTSFVDSIGEELTRQFSCSSELSVLSYHTTRMLSPEKSEIKNLISSHNVQYLISGSSRLENSKIKIFVELIDAESESQVWSGVYYQTIDDANFFKAIDSVVCEVMFDLSKIKNMKCDDGDKIKGVSEDLKRGKTDILYLDMYGIRNPQHV